MIYPIYNAKYYEDKYFQHDMLQAGHDGMFVGSRAHLFGDFTIEKLKDAIEKRTLPDGTRSRLGKGPNGFEIVLSPSKTVDIALAVASDAISSRTHFDILIDSGKAAYGLQFAEGLYAKRSAKGNDYTLVDGHVAIMPNCHDRAGVYNLHLHCVMLRTGLDAQDKPRTIDIESIQEALIQAAFNKKLDDHLRSLGIRTELRNNKVHATDVPQIIVDAWSIRTQQINEYLKKHGLESTLVTRTIATHQTKPEKQFWNHPERMILLKRDCEKLGLTAAEIIHKRTPPADYERQWQANAVVKAAFEEVGKSKIIFSRVDVLTAAITKSIGTDARLEDVVSNVNQRLERTKDFGIIQTKSGFTLESEVARAESILNVAKENIQATAAKAEEQVKEDSDTRYSKVTVEIDTKTSTVSIQDDSVAKYIQDTTQPGLWKAQRAGIAAFLAASGNPHKRALEAEKAWREKRRDYTQIQSRSVLTVSDAGLTPTADLKVLIKRTIKADSRVVLRDSEEVVERLRKELKEEHKLERGYSFEVVR